MSHEYKPSVNLTDMLYTSVAFCAQALLLSHLCFAQHGQQILTIEAQLRKATLDDADDIATILMAAFEPMPDWQYFRQFRHEFPEGHRECVRYGVMQMLTNPHTNTEVIEARDGSAIPLVAMATWSEHQVPSMLSVFERDAPKGCYQSLNVTRALDYIRQFNAAEHKYVFNVFGETQVYLFELATHPDYQLKGAGTRLIERGIAKGRRESVNVTLIAQPTAEGFYFKKGFKEVRNISVDSVDRDQSFVYNVMAYDFDGGP